MSKKWKPNPFKNLEKNLFNDFLKEQENKLDADHQWQPKKDGGPPINDEYAIVDPNRRT